jgi:hypothetical protein
MNANDYNMAVWKILDWTGSVAQIGGISASQWNQLEFFTSGTSKLILNGAGNLGLGVTPSNSFAGSVSFEIGASGILWSEQASSIYNSMSIGSNFYFNSAGSLLYKNTGVASSRYTQYQGSHVWYSAPSGTAGNAISFTQAMTLFATGNLLVGTPSPISDNGAKLQVSGTATVTSTVTAGRFISSTLTSYTNDFLSLNIGTVGQTIGLRFGYNGSTYNKGAVYFISKSAYGVGDLIFALNNSETSANVSTSNERMRITSSGNLGLGVTPSAWGIYKAYQVGWGSIASYDGADTAIFSNTYFDGGTWRYIGTGPASQYRQLNSIHSWSTAPSGTAGNAISFTQAMTLFATGNLLVGTPSPISDNGARLQVSGTATIGTTSNGGNVNAFVSSYGNNGLFQSIGTDGALKLQMGGLGTNEAFFYTGPSNKLTFYSGGAVALTIASTGAATFSSSVTADSFIRSGGTSSQYLMADGSVSTLSNPVTGTGTTNYLPKFTGSTTIGNSNISDDGSGIIVTGGAVMTSGWNRNTILEATYPVLVYNSNGSKWAGIGYDYSAGLRIWVNASSSDVNLGANNVLFIDNSGAATFSSSVTATNGLFNSGTNQNTIGSGSLSLINFSAYNSSANQSITLGLALDTAVNNNIAYNYLLNVGGDATAQTLTLSSRRRGIADLTILSINGTSGNVLIGTTTNGASKLRIVGLPTSSAGLSSGDVWNDSGTLKIA